MRPGTSEGRGQDNRRAKARDKNLTKPRTTLLGIDGPDGSESSYVDDTARGGVQRFTLAGTRAQARIAFQIDFNCSIELRG